MRTCTTAFGACSPLPLVLFLSHLQGNSLVIQILLRASWKMQIHVFQFLLATFTGSNQCAVLFSKQGGFQAYSSCRKTFLFLCCLLQMSRAPVQNLSFLQNCWGVVLFFKSKFISAQSWLHFKGEVVPFCEYSLKCVCVCVILLFPSRCFCYYCNSWVI